jgi:hypothetical protein
MCRGVGALTLAACLIRIAAAQSSVTPTPSPSYCSPGVVATLAGGNGATQSGAANGIGTAATFTNPTGVAVDAMGNTYIADTSNNVIRTISSGTLAVTTFAGNGALGVVNGVGTSASFSGPWGIAIDAAGANIYTTEPYVLAQLIRAIDVSTATVTTLAGGGTASGFTNGVGTAATFRFPVGLAVDGTGNLFVADSANCAIRKIVIATAVVTTLAGSGVPGQANGVGVAATFNNPYGVAADNFGNVFVADFGNCAIRAIVAGTGVVTTLAGGGTTLTVCGNSDGVGTAALFTNPNAIVIDGSGSTVYATTTTYSSFNSAQVRTVVVSTGTVGSGVGNASSPAGYANGPGASATFSRSFGGIAISNGPGLLYLSDTENNLIRLACSPMLPSPPPSASISASASPSQSPSTSPVGQLFRSLLRTDLVGTLLGASSFTTASEASCRSACLATPGCDSYAFSTGVGVAIVATFGQQPALALPCYLYANLTALVPNSAINSGVLYARYS